MNKKKILKDILKRTIEKFNKTKVIYHYVLLNEEINEIMKDKRITNKRLILKIKSLENSIETMEDEIRFLTNND